MTRDERESEIRRIGEALAARMGAARPGMFSLSEWKGRAIQRATAHERFRTALFRFVDVLPAVADGKRLMGLAQEYFEEIESAAADAFGWGLKTATRGGLFRKVGARVVRGQVEELARQFIIADTPAAAMKPLKKQWAGGMCASVDLLGEVTLSTEEGEAFRQRYLDLLERLAKESADWPDNPVLTRDDEGELPRTNISVKLSALDPLLAPAAWDSSVQRAKDTLRPILGRAKELNAHVHVDMEHHDLKDLTLTAVMELLDEPEFADGPSAGVVLQAYLKSAESDLTRLTEWAARRRHPVSVRLVKGAYWDQEVITHTANGWPVPVWQDKADTDRTYEAMTHTLLKHRELLCPAFAGHNLRSVANVIALAESLDIPKNGYEFQVIHGMAEPLATALVGEGYRVRNYCPVGKLLPGMAYLVRRLLENTANTSMLQRMYGRDEDLGQLLAAPESRASAAAPANPHLFYNEPVPHFTDPWERERCENSIDHTRSRLGGDYPAMIDGAPVETTRWITSINPADGEQVVGRVPECGHEEARLAVQGAQAAFAGWAATPVATRAETLLRTADILRKDRHELAALQLFEVGKSRQEAAADVAEAIDFLAYYAREMMRRAEPRRLGRQYPGELNETRWRPRGVCAVISPWNFPAAIPCGMIAAALVTGNTVVFKPSERAPVCGARLAAAFREGGVPDGVLQFTPGTGAGVGNDLVFHPEVRLIAFTGSREVGLHIHKEAAEVPEGTNHVKRIIAEMGGKNAVIVDETADLDEAVAHITASALGFQGQKCSACSRVIAVEAVHDALVQRLVAAFRSQPVGPPEDPAFRVGPVIDERAREEINQYIDIGKQEGTPALIADNLPGGGSYVGPAIFTGIQPHHRIAREEIFGPVVAVLKAASLTDAIRMANESDYGLTGGLISRSPAAIEQAVRDFHVGNLYINRTITGALVGRQPFGGHRLSGIGAKVGGEEYLTQFMLQTAVSENTMRHGFSPGHGPHSGPR